MRSLCALLVIFGIVMNRVNVFLVGYKPAYETHRYFPSIGEMALTVGVVCTIVFCYRLAVILFPMLSSAHAGDERVLAGLGVDVRQIARSEVGDGGDPRADLPVAPRQRHEQTVEVEPRGAARDSADDVDAERGEHGVRRVEARGGVVVAADDDDAQVRKPAAGLAEEPEPRLLGARRGIGRVEDVAGDEQRIGAMFVDRVQPPVEEATVLDVPRHVMEGVAQVPIGRVQEAEP